MITKQAVFIDGRDSQLLGRTSNKGCINLVKMIFLVLRCPRKVVDYWTKGGEHTLIGPLRNLVSTGLLCSRLMLKIYRLLSLPENDVLQDQIPDHLLMIIYELPFEMVY